MMGPIRGGPGPISPRSRRLAAGMGDAGGLNRED